MRKSTVREHGKQARIMQQHMRAHAFLAFRKLPFVTVCAAILHVFCGRADFAECALGSVELATVIHFPPQKERRCAHQHKFHNPRTFGF
jgi:CO/xanthine dehydrogenase FAD-binding subunit